MTTTPTWGRPSAAGSNPAIYGHRKTGHLWRPETGVEFYFMGSCARKDVWTLVRQLRGSHLCRRGGPDSEISSRPAGTSSLPFTILDSRSRRFGRQTMERKRDGFVFSGPVGLEFRIRSLNRGLGHHCVAPEF